MNQSLPTTRFTNRVANYVKFRPGYPPEMLDFFCARIGLTQQDVVADVGSGTGISAEIFLKNGNRVFGVEPNEAMRNAGATYLAAYPNFVSVDGTAEQTSMPDDSVDLIVSAQAFHWFDQVRARTEFRRILREHGFVALIWNERQLNTTPFLSEYEAFLMRYAHDYEHVRHENVNENKLAEFFESEYSSIKLQNIQVLDFEGLLGRVLSSSYMPDESATNFSQMAKELQTVFAKHAQNGRIQILYDTKVFFARL